jgi:hypothetical protein
VVSIKLLLLYPQGNITRYSLDRRLGGPQIRSVSCGRENISQTCWESNPVSSVVHPTAYDLCRLILNLLNIFKLFISYRQFSLWRSESLFTVYLTFSSAPKMEEVYFSETPVKFYQITRHQQQNKLRGLSPRANYTYRATTAFRRSYCQRLRIEGATWSAWRIPTAVFSVF